MSCGLIQNSEDIQQVIAAWEVTVSCGLIQNSEDIQQKSVFSNKPRSCGLIQNSEDIQHTDYGINGTFVVVWYKIQKIFNPNKNDKNDKKLWFDTKFRRYSTMLSGDIVIPKLWFDTKFRRYSTKLSETVTEEELWFDTKFRRYSTLEIVLWNEY